MSSRAGIGSLFVIAVLAGCGGHHSRPTTSAPAGHATGSASGSVSATARCPVTLPRPWVPPPGVPQRALFGSDYASGQRAALGRRPLAIRCDPGRTAVHQHGRLGGDEVRLVAKRPRALADHRSPTGRHRSASASPRPRRVRHHGVSVERRHLPDSRLLAGDRSGRDGQVDVRDDGDQTGHLTHNAGRGHRTVRLPRALPSLPGPSVLSGADEDHQQGVAGGSRPPDVVVAPPGLLPRPAASPSATTTHTSRITRTQQRRRGVQSPLDLRCVRPGLTAGFRLAGTVNWKTGRYARIVQADLALAAYPIAQLVGDLPRAGAAAAPAFRTRPIRPR